MTPDRERLLRAAARIGAALCREAIWAGDRCAWVARVEEGGPGGPVHAAHRATGPDLHGGSAGIALFLAHLHALTGEPVFRMTALGAAAHAASRLEDVPPPARAGLHGGWAGTAWALDQVARATGEDEPARRARDALRALAEGDAAAAAGRPGDPAPDVMSGGAGGIAALLRLAGDDDGSPLVDLAIREGERLLALATRGPAGWSWRTIGGPGEPHLCGVSHGASGIGVALLELAAHTGDERFLEAGRGAFAFESSHFSSEAGGWPDLRVWPGQPPPPGGAFSPIWCHGAAGGALARLRADALDPSPRLRAEAERALATCREAAAADGGGGDRTLCHGAAGIGEALLAGAEAFHGAAAAPGERGGAGLARAAIELAERHLAAEERGAMPRSGLPSGAETPALILGAAGFGHHLLRLCAPHRAPTVLQVAGTDRRVAQRAAA